MNISLIIAFLLSFILGKALIFKHSNPLLTLIMLMSFSSIKLLTVYMAYNSPQMIGEFHNYANLNILFVFCLLLYDNKVLSAFRSKYFICCAILLLLNYLNPHNVYRNAIIPPVTIALQLFLLLHLIRIRYPLSTISHSLYESVGMFILLQFAITICFPVLNMSYIADLFRDSGLEGALRERDGASYYSAIGTFGHPANLGLVASVTSIFFYNCYLQGERKRLSMFLLLAGCFTVFFTFSRTCYVLLFASCFLSYLMFRQIRFSTKMIVYLSMAFFASYYLVSKIPFLSSLFLGDNSNEMAEARFLHWAIGYEIWNEFKILGTGLNNHVYYMMTNFASLASFNSSSDFLITNPIHNVHIIVLVEMGIIGLVFSLWLYKELIFRYYKYNFIFDNETSSLSCRIIVSTSIFVFLYNFTGWSFCLSQVFTIVAFIIYFCSLNVNIGNNEKNRYIDAPL